MKVAFNLKLINFLFVVIFASFSAQAEIIQMIGASADQSLFNKYIEEGNPSYTHELGFKFFGGYGLGLQYGLGYRTDIFELGVYGQVNWKEEIFTRKHLSGSGDNKNYDFQYFRKTANVYLALPIAKNILDLLIEYNGYVGGTVHYSDKKSENPFRKDDYLNGTGKGVGFRVRLGVAMWIATYRFITYDQIRTQSTLRDLPDDIYSLFQKEEINTQVVVTF